MVDLQRAGVLGWEALSRGPSGTEPTGPLNMFEAAETTDLVFELDRHCRARALGRRDLPCGHKLFINVFPPSMYDPDFQGAI